MQREKERERETEGKIKSTQRIVNVGAEITSNQKHKAGHINRYTMQRE